MTPDRGGAERNKVASRDDEVNSRSFLTSLQPQLTDGVNYQDTPGEQPQPERLGGTPLVRASALHGVSTTPSLRGTEATWAQPLIREELS